MSYDKLTVFLWSMIIDFFHSISLWNVISARQTDFTTLKELF